MFFSRLEGSIGKVTIPSIGLSVGTINHWSLQRRESATPGSDGEWELRAVFSYLNEFAWNSSDWDKEIRVTIGNTKTGREYRITPSAEGRTVLDGVSLIIEGVSIDNV